MSDIGNSFTYYFEWLRQNPLISILDVLLVTLVIYLVLLLVRGTRAMQVLRGLIGASLIIVALGTFIDLPAFRWLISKLFPTLLIAVPVIFQPELRRALEQLGRARGWFRKRRISSDDAMISQLATACRRLSARSHGALIVIEQDTGLKEYIDTGVELDALVSAELLLAIFHKDAELHDGAIIIKDNRIVAASCVMPLSASLISDRKIGLRHRAALGTSEISDAISIIVSEETGRIAIAHNGRILRRQDPARLEATLKVFLNGEEKATDVKTQGGEG